MDCIYPLLQSYTVLFYAIFIDIFQLGFKIRNDYRAVYRKFEIILKLENPDEQCETLKFY